MAIRQSFKVSDQSSAANFKEWASEICAALGALGWIQTADTGQIDWTTNPAVPAAGVYLYQIWRMADALQATLPIFLKVEFGSIAGPLPSFRYTVGTATNGAGQIIGINTGAPIVLPAVAGQVNQGVAQFECDFSGSTGRFSMLMWRNCTGVNNPFLLVIDRSKDNAGADTDEYVTIVHGAYSNNIRQQSIVKAVGATNAETQLVSAAIFSSASAAFNNKVAVLPIFPLVGQLGNPMLGCASIKAADFPEGTTFTCTMYGVVRTFLVTKNAAWTPNFGAASGLYAAALRWD